MPETFKPGGGPTGTEPIREVTDPAVMRALSHPVRLALIEVLTLWGPLTATEAGERIDESPTTCSYHLRQLAKYLFVEEAGGGRGRARPWRVTRTGFSVKEPESAHDEVAAEVLLGSALSRQVARHTQARRARRAYPELWRQIINQNETVWWVTAEEAEQLNTAISDLVMRYRDRFDPARRPEGARPVEFVALTHPFERPEENAGDGAATPPDEGRHEGDSHSSTAPR